MAKPARRHTRPLRPNPAEAGTAAVLEQVFGLRRGDLSGFAPAPPPEGVRSFLRRASAAELQGALIEVLAALHREQGA